MSMYLHFQIINTQRCRMITKYEVGNKHSIYLYHISLTTMRHILSKHSNRHVILTVVSTLTENIITCPLLGARIIKTGTISHI